MNVVLCQVGEAPRYAEVEQDLKTLQVCVQGNIEVVPLMDNLLLICNEDGRATCSFNRSLYSPDFTYGYTDIYGDFLLCSEGDIYHDFGSISSDLTKVVSSLLCYKLES